MDDSRLRALLDVGQSLISELDPDALLERVLEVARELTGARYAAIGVLDEHKEVLDRFLTAGAHKWVNFSMDAMLGRDRQATDARFDPTLPNMNDLDFLMRLYERSAGSFHIGEALHLYVKQPASLSNGAGMTERMIAAKTLIRERLAAGYYRFADGGAVEGLDAFLAVSLEAERLYPAALAARPGLIFDDHIEPLLRAAATSAS